MSDLPVVRSNVRAVSNVQVRLPGTDVVDDVAFREALRTRPAIRIAFPQLFSLGGFDPLVARDVLTPFQITVARDHFPCHCGRWDRWPICREGVWELSFTPLGCICSR